MIKDGKTEETGRNNVGIYNLRIRVITWFVLFPESLSFLALGTDRIVREKTEIMPVSVNTVIADPGSYVNHDNGIYKKGGAVMRPCLFLFPIRKLIPRISDWLSGFFSLQ